MLSEMGAFSMISVVDCVRLTACLPLFVTDHDPHRNSV